MFCPQDSSTCLNRAEYFPFWFASTLHTAKSVLLIETLETPRLKGIDVSDFVNLKEKRQIYERKVQEKSTEQKIKVFRHRTEIQ